MKSHKIGRGKNMSIAKAALVVFYHDWQHPPHYLYTGELDLLHEVVEVAGANHCGPATHQQVISCLNASPYWEAKGVIPGWGNRWANALTPSEEGKAYYEDHLKGKVEYTPRNGMY